MVTVRLTAVAALALAAAAHSPALADPKFEYAKPEDPPPKKKVVWKAGVQLGAILTTGNSTTTTVSAAGGFSRFDGRNKMALDVAGAFARSEFLAATDYNGDKKIQAGEVYTIAKTTVQNWLAKVRYDLFISKRHAIYHVALVAGDEPAGKKIYGGGQVGYALGVYKSARHEIAAEVGYDFTYQVYLKPDTRDLQLHSLRAFASWAVTPIPDTTVALSVEGLFNVNNLDTPTGMAKPFEGTRVNGKALVTTKLVENIGLRASFTIRYDNWPAPRPSFDIPYADGFVPSAQKLDTLTDVSLIVTFL